MSPAISRLLRRAASEAANHGAVFADTQSLLADEGYLLSALDNDVDRILAVREEDN